MRLISLNGLHSSVGGMVEAKIPYEIPQRSLSLSEKIQPISFVW